MGLSTCASRLLHKRRENDTICVLKQQSYFCCGCRLVSMIPYLLVRSGGSHSQVRRNGRAWRGREGNGGTSALT